MTIKSGNQIRLKDGRRLGYAEYGDPNGKPVVHFHGNPCSRLEGVGYRDRVAARLGVRLVMPDRPGFGISDFKPNRAILDWADDVVELADALNLEHFAVMGYSAGGPYAAACAFKIPQRLTAVGIVSGIGPIDAPGALEGMTKTNRTGFTLGPKAPWLLRLYWWNFARQLRGNPERFITQRSAQRPEPDRVALADPEVREIYINVWREGFRHGARGATWETLLFARSWGFHLQDIHIPVYLWHGELDNAAPIKYMASAIPDCRAKFFPQDGHISLIVNHYEELLRAMVC